MAAPTAPTCSPARELARHLASEAGAGVIVRPLPGGGLEIVRRGEHMLAADAHDALDLLRVPQASPDKRLATAEPVEHPDLDLALAAKADPSAPCTCGIRPGAPCEPCAFYTGIATYGPGWAVGYLAAASKERE